MPANDALQLSRLRGQRESELETRTAMGTDPQASGLLRLLRGQMTEDPYTGDAERERIEQIREGLDEQAFYNHPESTDIRTEQHNMALQKLLLPARLQAEIQAQRQNQTFANQQELERMRQSGRSTENEENRELRRQLAIQSRQQQTQMQQGRQTEAARVAEGKRKKSIWERLGLVSAPAAATPAPMQNEQELDENGLPFLTMEELMQLQGGR